MAERVGQDWFEQFYNAGFSDMTYTPAAAACLYVSCLKSALGLVPKCVPPTKLRILDQCCGDGAITAAMARTLRCEVLGIDLSGRTLSAARRRYRGMKNLWFKKADARKFRVAGGFDVVTCWHTSCSYSEDDNVNKRQLACMCSSLKRGGVLVVDTMNPVYVRENFIETRSRILDDGTLVGTWYRLSGKMLSSTWKVCSPDDKVETFTGMTKLYGPDEYTRMLAEYGVDVIDIRGGLDFSPLSDSLGRMVVIGTKK